MDELDFKIILALADSQMNVAEVSRNVFLHRNTVMYRVQKIKRLTGLDPLDFYELATLICKTTKYIGGAFDEEKTKSASC